MKLETDQERDNDWGVTDTPADALTKVLPATIINNRGDSSFQYYKSRTQVFTAEYEIYEPH